MQAVLTSLSVQDQAEYQQVVYQQAVSTIPVSEDAEWQHQQHMQARVDESRTKGHQAGFSTEKS